MAASTEFQLYPNGANEMPPTYAALLQQTGVTEMDGDLITVTEAGLPRRVDPFPLAEERVFRDESPLSDADISRILYGLRHLDESRTTGRHRTLEETVVEATPEPEPAAAAQPRSWFEPFPPREAEPAAHAHTTAPPHWSQFDRVREYPRVIHTVPVIPGPTAARAPVPPKARVPYVGHGAASPRPEANLQTTSTAINPAVGWRDPSCEGKRPGQEDRINAFLAPEPEPEQKTGSRLLRLVRRIGTAVTKAAMPVMEEEPRRKATAHVPVATPVEAHAQGQADMTSDDAEVTRVFGELPSHVVAEHHNGRTYLVELEQVGKMRRLGRFVTFGSHDPERIRNMPVDLDDADSIQDARHMFGLSANRRAGDARWYRGSRRYKEAPAELQRQADAAFMQHPEYAKRHSMTLPKFLARGLGYTALGGGAALGSVLAATNPEKVSNAIDAARQLVESVLS